MNGTSVVAAREKAVAVAMDDIRRIEADLGVTREGVDAIRDRLIAMSGERHLFPLDDFVPPGDDTENNSFMYRLAQDDDDRFALYAQATRGGTETPPHNHTTWAVVVGFEGQELNQFYDHTPDGGVQKKGQHMVEAGTGMAMLPDELHSIHIDGSALNFHCYGLALERLTERVYYSPTNNEWKIYSSVSSIREGRSTHLDC